MSTSRTRRERMVEQQIAGRGVDDPRTLEAMRTVPRERFVPGHLAEFAYDDTPLPIAEGQTISQPFIVALMIEALGIQPGERVLEVGAGSGYAAAVLSRVAAEVYAVERHEALATAAQERAAQLGYDNVQVLHGDGTLGWSEHAPYDAILVSAGGPDVPQALLDQLSIGGRLIIPIGREQRVQELIRVTRRGQDRYERESIGRVQFVPLIGSEGWSADGMPVAPRRARRPLRLAPPKRERLSSLIASSCEPFDDIEVAALTPLLDRIGEAQVVLIGEATHGTSEFYRMRARITRELIRGRGFSIVAIEGDWPDVQALNRYIQGHPRGELRTPPFSRFPTWMWRNEETLEFTEFARTHNRERPHDAGDRVGIYGLDLYGLNNSIGAVLDYLDRVDPAAAEAARLRYACFSPWEIDPATYGRAAVSGNMDDCEQEVIGTLTDLLDQRMRYLKADGEEFFDAERNATVIREAERYYRAMYRGSRESWNLRDRHMFDTLQAVMQHRGDGARAVVWAHNSHIGNAAATEMGMRGEFNIGQLAREHYRADAYAIGFGTDHGTVAAADNWDEPMQVMALRPSHEDSYERLCHETGIESFFLPLRSRDNAEVRRELLSPHLERAIGVIYRPRTEMLSHYFQAALPAQFDEYIWFDETAAVRPLPQPVKTADAAQTYPFAL